MEQVSLSKYWHPILMVWLQFMDAIATLFLVAHGAQELNPIMDAALQQHTVVFCMLKFLSALLSVWLWTKNKTGAWIVTIVFILVVAWNTTLVCILLAR